SAPAACASRGILIPATTTGGWAPASGAAGSLPRRLDQLRHREDVALGFLRLVAGEAQRVVGIGLARPVGIEQGVVPLAVAEQVRNVRTPAGARLHGRKDVECLRFEEAV